jgi:hypothetical protein
MCLVTRSLFLSHYSPDFWCNNVHLQLRLFSVLSFLHNLYHHVQILEEVCDFLLDLDLQQWNPGLLRLLTSHIVLCFHVCFGGVGLYSVYYFLLMLLITCHSFLLLLSVSSSSSLVDVNLCDC